MSYYLMYLFYAFLFSWLLISPFRFLGTRYKIWAKGSKDLASYRKKLPLLGGCPLYFSFVLTILTFLFWKMGKSEFSFEFPPNTLLVLLVGAAFLSFVGFIHDIISIPLVVRIATQLLAGFMLVLADIRCHISFLEVIPIQIGDHTLFLGNALLTMVWVVFLVQVMDVLEELDGMIVGIGIIISLFLFGISIFGYDYMSAFFSIVIAGSLGGLLWDQLYPPTIGLGKMGSGFIGFMFAALTLNISYSQLNDSGALPTLLLLILPLGIGGGLCFYKLKKKSVSIEEVLAILQNKGSTNSRIVFKSILITTLAGVCSLILLQLSSQTLLLVFFVFLLIVVEILFFKLTSALPSS